MMSHNQKSYVAPHFTWPDIRNATVPLIIPLATSDTIASASGVIEPKSHLALHFNCLDLRNALVLLTTLSTSHDARAGANGVT